MKLVGTRLIPRREIDEISLHQLRYVYFPKPFENLYRQQYQQEAAREFRYRAPIILALYLFLNIGMYQMTEQTHLTFQWFDMYVWVGIIIFIAWLCSFNQKINQYFDLYVGIGATACIAITFVMIVFVDHHTRENALFHASMMYAVIIVYGFSGLRFYSAMLAAWLGGLIAVIFCLVYEQNINWTILNRTYTFSSFLGMALCYAIDRQHRENYLQHCLLELNQSKLTEQAKQLEYISRLDALTGLANRRYMDVFLETQWQIALNNKTPLTLMMIDIDCFKLYNDTLGHPQGDECLKRISQLFQATTLRRDELAIRYGGEEFLLIFPRVDESQARSIAEHLLQRVRDLAIHHPASNIYPYVTISIGLVNMLPEPHNKLSQFIDFADQALYQAKHTGRNRYVMHHFSASSA